jgi:hypothetical protein
MDVNQMSNKAYGRRALAVITLALGVVFAAACGSSSTTGQASPSASASTLACTSSGPASASWPAAPSAPASPATIVSVVANGDTLTITFRNGTPAFQVVPQATNHFVTDPRGAAIDTAGTAGAKIVLTGFRGDVSNYDGPVSITSSGQLLKQVYKLGDFEGTVSFAAGLSASGCANVTSSGSTLTFQFIHS